MKGQRLTVMIACVKMSLYQWFSSDSDRPYLPNSSLEKSKNKQDEVKKANERVLAVMETNNRKRCSTYNVYSPELRAKIGKCAAERGNHAAVKKFSMELGKPVCESTVREIKRHTTLL